VRDHANALPLSYARGWWLFTTPLELTLAKNPDPDQQFTPSRTPSFARSRLEGAGFAISRLNTRFFPLTPRKIKVRLHYGKVAPLLASLVAPQVAGSRPVARPSPSVPLFLFACRGGVINRD